MQNQEIIKIIENLKGRRDYEKKKASKLGFSSLYAYFPLLPDCGLTDGANFENRGMSMGRFPT